MLLNHRRPAVLVGAASALTLGLSTPALAGNHYSASNVRTVISGGDARALSLCGNLAKHGYDIDQDARCRNVDSFAVGGDVTLDNVDISVYSHAGRQKFTNVTTVISGGDATAVSACINAAFHSSDVDQSVKCGDVTSSAFGGNVTLTDVDIDVNA